MQIWKSLLLSLCATFCVTAPGHAALNDVAVFAPGVANGMTVQEQNEVAAYLTDPGRLPHTQVYNSANQGELVTWMNSRMFDGKSDVLLIVDLAPEQVFNGDDNSLAEAWMENGNMVIWTGSKPFESYVDAGGLKSSGGDISTVLDINEDIYGTPYIPSHQPQPQQPTSVATNEPGFYNYLPSLNLNYDSGNMLDYAALLINAQNVTSWDDAPNMVIDEIFAESTGTSLDTVKYLYESDALVLTMRQTESDRKGQGGQYGQFYTSNGLVDGVAANTFRKPVLYEFLHNWVAKNINLIYVEAGAFGGDGSEAHPYGTIQAGINAAEEFSRDRVMVKPGTYNETLVMKRSVKLISVGDDIRGDVVGHLDDFDNPELDYTYNEFPQVNARNGLLRAQATIIDGIGQAPAAMVDIPKWASLGTWVDGFTIQNMPEVDPGVCGNPHTILMGGSSPLIIDNIVQNNGSAGLTSYAMFDQNSSGVSVEDDICLNDDFSYANVKYSAHPALINNIISTGNGPNIAANFYAYPIIYHNESFKSGYFGDDLPETIIESPGIGIKHGARPYVVNNVVYDSSWTGIGAQRGVNELTWVNPVDRGTSPWIVGNYVLNSGTANIVNGGAGIGAKNTGRGDGLHYMDFAHIDYHFIAHNFIYNSNEAAIGCSYQGDEDGSTTTVAKETVGYVYISDNTGVGSGKAGIGIHGIYGAEWISHNELTANTRAGIGIKDEATVGMITDNSLYANEMAGIGMKSGASVCAIESNSIKENGLAGIGHSGYNDDGSPNKVKVGHISDNIIEWNDAAGIGMVHAEAFQIFDNQIKYNALPGITITEDSDVCDGSMGGLYNNHLLANGRADLQGHCTNTAGLVIAGEGSTAVIYGGIIEESGMVNVKIGEGTEVTMDGVTVRKNMVQGPNIRIDGVADIKNCLLEDSVTPGIAVGETAVLSLVDTVIANSGTAGIAITGAVITSFSGNTVSGSQTAGIVSSWIEGDFHIENSTITNNGTPGIVLEDLEYNVIISDCTISGNGMGGVRVNNSQKLDILDTVIHNENGGVVVNDTTAEQAMEVSLSNCDLYHLEAGMRMHGGTSLTITDSELSAIWVQNIETVSLSGSTLAVFASNKAGVLLEHIGWVDIIDNYLEARWPVLLRDCSGNIVNNVTGDAIGGFGCDAYVFDYGSTVNFYHNTIYGGDSPINMAAVIANRESTVYAYNNIITGTRDGIKMMGGSVLHADNNLFWGNRREFFSWPPEDGTFYIGDNNLIDVNPELVDPANGDYHLSPTSPAIDAGDGDIEVAEDMDGDSRPQGGGSDIGADEVVI